MKNQTQIAKWSPMKSGQRYGRLVAVRFLRRDKSGSMRWLFQCDCGRRHVSIASHVRSGGTRSCGCYRNEVSSAYRRSMTTHRMSKSVEYRCWAAMLNRCNNSRNKDYADYGGRGIRVCKRWRKFENFYADMGPRPSPEHSLDRKNNDLGYIKRNCRWATAAQQKMNRRITKGVRYRGRTMLLIEACRLAGIKHALARDRLRRGWSVKRAMSS